MSTLEKNIYKQVNVPSNKRSQVPPESRSYRGISTVNTDDTSWTKYDIALIKQDILNHFHIQKGEKLSDPSFGTIIWAVLFDPLTDDLKKLIAEDVTEIINSDPRVVAESIVVDEYDKGIEIQATLRYLNFNISESMRITFDQDNGL